MARVNEIPVRSGGTIADQGMGWGEKLNSQKFCLVKFKGS
jgi:hypothetical protein